MAWFRCNSGNGGGGDSGLVSIEFEIEHVEYTASTLTAE